jgi:hypothetical protein
VVSGSETGFAPGGGGVDVLDPGTVPVEAAVAEMDRAPAVDGATAGRSARTADWADWGPEESTPNRISVPPATIRARARKALRR